VADDDLILDISPKTAAQLAGKLKAAGTIVWNGRWACSNSTPSLTALWMRGPTLGVTVYQTLGADAAIPRHATIRAVLDPALSLGDLQAMLAELRLQIVGGPSSAGVFSLAPEAGAASVTTAQTVSMLRSRAGVRFAEPTDGGTERR
jgi:hypothetical protein